MVVPEVVEEDPVVEDAVVVTVRVVVEDRLMVETSLMCKTYKCRPQTSRLQLGKEQKRKAPLPSRFRACQAGTPQHPQGLALGQLEFLIERYLRPRRFLFRKRMRKYALSRWCTAT